jgi:hypothetical protein
MGGALRLVKMGLGFLVTLVVFDVAGVLLGFFLIDVWSTGGDDGPGALAYALWGVIGLLCGAIGFHVLGSTFADALAPGEDGGRVPGAFRRGLEVFGVASACLGLVAGVLYCVSWRLKSFSDPYVPDSATLTGTFFAAILAGMGFMLYALKR